MSDQDWAMEKARSIQEALMEFDFDSQGWADRIHTIAHALRAVRDSALDEAVKAVDDLPNPDRNATAWNHQNRALRAIRELKSEEGKHNG